MIHFLASALPWVVALVAILGAVLNSHFATRRASVVRELNINALKSIESHHAAHVWNGVGPEDECLVRILTKDECRVEWVHVLWLDEDYSEDSESVSHTRAGYYVVGCLEPIAEWGTVTHYAQLPEVSP